MVVDAESIGDILRTRRQERGLELEQVHEATKITPENLAALEENRFDVFANKVYARAFLRDYANFLDLDSASLLARYEEEWAGRAEPEPVARASRSTWRAVGYAVLVIVLVGAAAGGSYFWWTGSLGLEHTRRHAASRRVNHPEDRSVVPAAPAPAVRHEPKPTPEIGKPTALPRTPEPQQAPVPVPSEKITLEVTALRGVWVRVKCDGKKAYEAIMPAGASKRFEAKDAINIRAGMAGAVRLVFNGEPQQPLGTLQKPGEKTFRRDAPTSSPTGPPPTSPF